MSYLLGRPVQLTLWNPILAADPAVQAATPLSPGRLASFLTALTPVFLRADTRVTDYHFRDGAFSPAQAVLEAGTAVLVDTNGIPRIRCISGTPLAAPVAASLSQKGQAWPGYDTSAVVSIAGAKVPIREFGVLSPDGTTPFRRTAGTTGDFDIEQLPTTGSLAGDLIVTGVR